MLGFDSALPVCECGVSTLISIMGCCAVCLLCMLHLCFDSRLCIDCVLIVCPLVTFVCALIVCPPVTFVCALIARSLYRCLCQRTMQPQAVGGHSGRQGEVQLCSFSTRWDLLLWCVVACNVCCEGEML